MGTSGPGKTSRVTGAAGDAGGKPAERAALLNELDHLRQENARLQRELRDADDMLGVSPVFCGILSAEGAVLVVNDLALRNIDAAREQVVGTLLWQADWWSSLPEAAARIRGAVAAARSGRPSQLEVPYVCVEGGTRSERWGALSFSPSWSDAGRVSRIAVSGVDITESHEAQRALHASRERLRQVIEASGTSTWELDVATGQITIERMLIPAALPPDGTFPLEAVLAGVHPEDRERVRRALSSAPQSDRSYELEFRTLSPVTGEERWVEGRGRVTHDEKGRVILRGTGVDITRRKRAEVERERVAREIELARTRLHGLFEKAPALVCMLRGPDHVFERVNPLSQQILGGGRPLVGLPVREAMPELAGQGVIDLLDSVYKTGEPFVGRDVLTRIRKSDGRLEDTYFSFIYQPARNNDNEVVGIDVFAFEVTEHVLARQKAESLAETLRQRAGFEKQLIGIVSHDLRNPVGVILLSVAALLRGDRLTERQLKNITRIQGSAQRAARMISDLLDFTQARLTGTLPIVCRPVDLHSLVQSAVEDVEANHGRREVRIRHQGDGTGQWDPDRLDQVVQNLVTNAIKYSPADTPVKIETQAKGDEVELIVQNQGSAIPPERLSSLFQPLQRATGELDKSGRSIGLGLYIVKQVVAAHGGSIAVRSISGEGTTFTVRLPRKPQPKPDLSRRDSLI